MRLLGHNLSTVMVQIAGDIENTVRHRASRLGVEILGDLFGDELANPTDLQRFGV
jgi:hypothetical protein